MKLESGKRVGSSCRNPDGNLSAAVAFAGGHSDWLSRP
jgi:hypothetical protein